MGVCASGKSQPVDGGGSGVFNIDADALVARRQLDARPGAGARITQLWLPLRVDGEVIAGRAEARVTVSVASPFGNRAVEPSE